MKISLSVIAITALQIASPAAAASMEYSGLCEASAAAYLDNKHFAVASDETNRIQIYERGKSEPVGSVDFESFTGFDKSDLEAAASTGSRIYWISSHSYNKNKQDKAKRKVFFATDVVKAGDHVTLSGVGKAFHGLRDRLVSASGLDPAEIDIEGLAATPDGQLLIGFRAPLSSGEASVMTFENPSAVVESGAAPIVSKPTTLDLRGMGIRSLERVGSGAHQYLIVAGPVLDANEGFALYWWDGKGKKVEPVVTTSIEGMIPEALINIPGSSTIQLLSDDGKLCSGSDDEPPNLARRFRSVEIKP